MKKTVLQIGTDCLVVLFVIMSLFSIQARAQSVIPGITDATFDLTVKADHIQTPDGGAYLMWGYTADDGSRMQYPGPTLIVEQGELITIRLRNQLEPVVPAGGPPAVPAPSVSMLFPGQAGVIASGGNPGLLTREAPPDGTTIVTYTFTASHAGTYVYYSGTQMELQIEMGLFGAIIVRPTAFDPCAPKAYGHSDSEYDHEVLFLFSELDPVYHHLVETGRNDEIDFNAYWPVNWFINGRCFPDTISVFEPNPMLPTQPYNCLPRLHPGETLLLRVMSLGRDSHPFHPHGNNVLVIARDGRLLESAPGAGADLAVDDYIIDAVPGATYDALFTWTGREMGWDIYGHDPCDPCEPAEYAPDHGKPFPVVMPETQDITPGAAYSGSPFLGGDGPLPPGQGALNIFGGFFLPVAFAPRKRDRK